MARAYLSRPYDFMSRNRVIYSALIAVAASAHTIVTLAADRPAAPLIPFSDVWCLAILEPTVASATLPLCINTLISTSGALSSAPCVRPLKTTPSGNDRPQCVTFRIATDSRCEGEGRVMLTYVLIQTLLHLDHLVWMVTASPIYDAGAWAQTDRVATVKREKTGFRRVRECERCRGGAANVEQLSLQYSIER